MASQRTLNSNRIDEIDEIVLTVIKASRADILHPDLFVKFLSPQILFPDAEPERVIVFFPGRRQTPFHQSLPDILTLDPFQHIYPLQFDRMSITEAIDAIVLTQFSKPDRSVIDLGDEVAGISIFELTANILRAVNAGTIISEIARRVEFEIGLVTGRRTESGEDVYVVDNGVTHIHVHDDNLTVD